MGALKTSKAEPRECARCGAVVLKGWAEGILAVVDVVAIIPITDELDTWIEGRETYELRMGELALRDEYRVKGKVHGTIHAQHRCAGGIQYTNKLEN